MQRECVAGHPLLISRCLRPAVVLDTYRVEADALLMKGFHGVLRAAGASPSTLTLQALCSSPSPFPIPRS